MLEKQDERGSNVKHFEGVGYLDERDRQFYLLLEKIFLSLERIGSVLEERIIIEYGSYKTKKPDDIEECLEKKRN